MAMTKKELAQLEMALTAAALRTTADVEPDVLPPDAWGELSTGYHFNAYTCSVGPGCTARGSHSLRSATETDSQGSIKLYSSALLAAKAMRRAIEHECARKLRLADLLIESFEQEGG